VGAKGRADLSSQGGGHLALGLGRSSVWVSLEQESPHELPGAPEHQFGLHVGR
jgi:hypothetical protein